ncbi:hypothetical protein F442_02972 [Phytophthora nicotianae P10297]|uniref:Uncharacterized protein n=6 Tax=Phytophthora nicotianae TaxID=4792 RepID=W2QQ76_PHYN3|nr:hypothetical protein PPTG_07672 [Phytophthora nicotianae INRA-310]ETM53694.1 hypothetical protein L914_02853 [Phytophthora nicotianae]ETN14669.1 hypothetical protein PPTG_07672 [Phytophthora nicotianae INRA-310]ETP51958.1 hypothetical protein F442_02972 [Phytophthora nicotianae P10297]
MDFDDPELERLVQGDWVKDHENGYHDNMVYTDQSQELQIRTLWSGSWTIQESDIEDPAFSSMREWILRISDGETQIGMICA